ncbi:MAG: NUDIX domain-containing protein [Candidatus Marinimicrobia bacterium]|nr:NUDIX domain-containing protein [Candidatus Neomarinimicrobiota bacterium]MCF7903884.1 NUDIX domain-containing protein [Candidatus Neomarinimicrobiota bacterium]
METTRHFTATTFVVYKDKTLLHKHMKLDMWLPPGGHIDRDELPHVAAKREVLEETGLEVEIIHDEPAIFSDNAREIPGPRHLLLENINPFHQHIDMIYFALASSFDVKPDANESQVLKWFSIADLQSSDIENDIRILGEEAVRALAEAWRA